MTAVATVHEAVCLSLVGAPAEPTCPIGTPAQRPPWTLLSLYEAYAAQVGALSRRYLGNASDAEDATQATFERLAPYLDRLASDARAYILQVARHTCYAELRRRRRLGAVSVPAEFATEADAESIVVQREAVRSVWPHLSARDQRLLGYAVAGLSHREMGRRLGLSENCTAVALSRARMRARRLAASLRASCGEGVAELQNA